MAKTLKLKKPEPTLTAKPVPAPGAEPAAAAPVAGEPPQQEGGIYVASRHRNPMEMADATTPTISPICCFFGVAPTRKPVLRS